MLRGQSRMLCMVVMVQDANLLKHGQPVDGLWHVRSLGGYSVRHLLLPHVAYEDGRSFVGLSNYTG